MHYKYTVYQTTGPNGTTVVHRQQEGVDITRLGEIDGVTYLCANAEIDLAAQPKQITLEQATLTLDEILTLRDQPYLSRKIEAIKQQASIDANKPVTVNGITYNGGDGSAAAINGAIGLANAKGLFVVTIWDINNVNAEYSLTEGMAIAAAIGEAYADVMYKRNEDIAALT
ncbi:MAG: hypothetical protein B6I36_07670 [Desulfobacteraceae bacterium 4572_35.1]|nr:MAG: hypothetical protein B6I36_07670 [Desulfobacteraceae bacterium 4572_35.1]